jgi:hypothetical protein
MHIVKTIGGIGAVLIVAFVISNIIHFKMVKLNNFDSQDMQLFSYYISYNSEEILKLLSDNNIEFRAMSKIDNDDITGLYFYDEIWIKEGYIQKSLNHEIGHFVDDYFKFSKNQEFIEIYNQEKDNMQKDYYKDDISEYFAECYKMYVERWPALDNYPQTKDFFERNIGRSNIQENFTFL